MKKITKLCFLIIGVFTILLISGVSSVKAQDERDSGAIWTPSDCGATADQDVMEFPYGTMVYIAGGNGLEADTEYYWSVSKTGGGDPVQPSTPVTTDGNGEFCFGYRIFMPGDDVNNGNPFNVDLKNAAGGNVSQDNFKIKGTVLTNTVSINVGACTWTEAGGSTRVVTLTITGGASVTIEKVGGGTWGPYTSNQTLSLSEGVYNYSWVPTEGYSGSGEDSFTVAPCPPASASHEILGCDWTELGGSLTDVQLYISHAELTLLGPGSALVGVYTTDTTVHDLTPGHYTYSWHALTGYSGSGTGYFDLLECEPDKGDASVSVEACVWDEQDGSSFIAHITVNNAALTIDGTTYYANDDVKLPAGYYTYTWVAIDPYTGSGSGSIDVEGCEPATVNVVVGLCDWIEMESLTPVTLTIHGALLDIYADDGGPTHKGQYGEGVHVVSLPPGSYYYTWTAVEDFTGAGRGEFETIDCEPGKADAAITIGACTYTDGQSLTLVTITISNATLTIDGQTFTEAAELKLLPGEYPYTWEAISEEYDGEGSGVLSVGSCEPKEEEKEPDVPAGGNGPSLIVTLTPALLTVSGIAMAWILVKFRIKKI